MAREKYGLLAVPPTLPGSRDVLRMSVLQSTARWSVLTLQPHT